MWQLQVSDFNEQEQLVAIRLIGNINDHGYLRVLDDMGEPLDGDEIIATVAYELDNDEAYVEEILEMLQQKFDPPGVGARDLRECLLIQSRYLELGAIVDDIIDGHMENLEKKNYQAIAREMGIELDEVIEAAKLISQLEPRPGRPFTSDATRYITPDIYIIKGEDGEYRSALNEDGMPRLRVPVSIERSKESIIRNQKIRNRKAEFSRKNKKYRPTTKDHCEGYAKYHQEAARRTRAANH